MTAPKYPEGDWRKPARQERTDLLEGQVAFLEWLTDPEAQATESQNQYALRVGVHKSTLARWKKDPIFRRAWEARLSDMNVSPDRLQDLMDVLWREGKYNGNVKAIELYMKLVDRMTPDRHVIQAETVAAVDMSDEQLAEELARRSAALRGLPS